MTFSNHINTPEDDEFIRNFPLPDEFDPEWVAKMESELSCQECEYYNDNRILPCAVNPEKVYHADECSDYSIGESND
jgi:hypothetical protein